MNFELNNVDTRFSQYQLATLASIIIDLPIKDINKKNELYTRYKKQKLMKDVSLKNINLDVKFTKALQEDRALIGRAITAMEGVYENVVVENRPKMKGVVAILDYDYK